MRLSYEALFRRAAAAAAVVDDRLRELANADWALVPPAQQRSFRIRVVADALVEFAREVTND